MDTSIIFLAILVVLVLVFLVKSIAIVPQQNAWII